MAGNLLKRGIFLLYTVSKKIFHPKAYLVSWRDCIKGQCCLSTELSSLKGAKFYFSSLSASSNVHLVATNGGRLRIGKGCFFNRNGIVVARNEITIGEGCLFGPNVCIYDHNHGFGANAKVDDYKLGSVVIGKNVWIGAQCVILSNTVIGDNCVIGAGCVVKGNIPANSLVTMSRELNVCPLR